MVTRFKVKKKVPIPIPKPTASLEENFWDIKRDGITQSTIATFLQCPMKAHYKMHKGLGGEGFNHALDFGSLFHNVLDKVYSYKKKFDNKEIKSRIPLWQDLSEEALKEVECKAMNDLDPSEVPKYSQMHGLCSIVLERYFTFWKEEDSKAQIIEVEEQFKFPYVMRDGTTIQIRGKIDRIDKDEKGNIWLFETKTKSTIEVEGRYSWEAITEKMHYQLQVMIYCMAIKYEYGKYPVGVVYNLVKRPGQLYTGKFNRKDETLDQYFQRVEEDIIAKTDFSSREKRSDYFLRYRIPLREEDIETWKLRDFDYIIQQIYEWTTWNLASYRNSTACMMYRKPCEFLPICSREVRVVDFNRRLKVFSELEEQE